MNTTTSQTSLASAQLKNIAAKVSYSLKLQAEVELAIHRSTIDRYLKGNAPNERRATLLLEFFQARISA